MELTDEHVLFRFNQATEAPGPFSARAELSVRSATASRSYSWARDEFMANDVLRISLSEVGNTTDYSISLYLDDHLAFKGRHEAFDLPW